MYYLKTIWLVNFMGYRDTVFDFAPNDDLNQLNLIFAPNGCGKSTLLAAINLVFSAPRLTGRDNSTLFRKLVFNEDYDPNYPKPFGKHHEMSVRAVLVDTKGKEYRVELNQSGVVQCEIDTAQAAVHIDADNPMNLNKFQFSMDHNTDKFLTMAETVYNFPTYFDANKNTKGVFGESVKRNAEGYHTDLIIEKYGVKVHFKSFSGGEKKLATMLALICDKSVDKASVIVIDSFEKEIYWKRQTRAIDQMISSFPKKQFFVVTHSQTLIEHVGKKYGQKCLYDIEQYKINDLGINGYDN